MLLPVDSVNQSAPSGPVVMMLGVLFGVGITYSVIAPAVVMRPILFCDGSVNHNAPSGPATIPLEPVPEAIGYRVIVPEVVIRPTLEMLSENHKEPSGPAAISLGWN
jgi:hypothetical protein